MSRRRRWRWRVAAALFTALAAIAVASTYRVFSQVYDEPAHVGAGMQWLSAERYTFEVQHPPLGRIAAALGPWLSGERLRVDEMWTEGNRILGSGPHYARTLALARLGELPFLFVLCWGCWAWGIRVAGERGGALAVLFAATNPNLLAHAALATTDIGPAAMIPVTLYAFARWLDACDGRRSVILGVTLGLALVTKFSAIAFLGPTLIIGYGLRMSERRAVDTPPVSDHARQACLTAAAAAFAVWAVYRFDVGPLPGSPLVVPAPEFFSGLLDFVVHGGLGHSSFLFGKLSSRGWWYYFPVVIALKTPIPLLCFGGAGLALAMRDVLHRRGPDAGLLLAGICTVLAVGMATNVNIGVRHILPLYPLLAVLAARAAVASWDAAGELARDARVRIALAALARAGIGATLAASVVVSGRAAPDFLAYFNPLAGSHPEQILSDSNLDWGQDLVRLSRELDRRGVDSLRIAYFGSADLAAVGVRHARPFGGDERVTGWIAVSETYLAGLWTTGKFGWLRAYTPVTEIGHSMRLYYIPPAAAPAAVRQAGAPHPFATRR